MSRVTDRPEVVRLMWDLGIRQGALAADLGISKQTLGNILNPSECGTVAFDTVLKARTEIEKRLRSRGWSGPSESLWAEFDNAILKEVA